MDPAPSEVAPNLYPHVVREISNVSSFKANGATVQTKQICPFAATAFLGLEKFASGIVPRERGRLAVTACWAFVH